MSPSRPLRRMATAIGKTLWFILCVILFLICSAIATYIYDSLVPRPSHYGSLALARILAQSTVAIAAGATVLWLIGVPLRRPQPTPQNPQSKIENPKS